MGLQAAAGDTIPARRPPFQERIKLALSRIWV